jgi:hypothetical protein
LAALVDTGGGEGLQLMKCPCYGPLVCLGDPRVVADKRGAGNRFGRLKCEIVKHPAICRRSLLAIRVRFGPRRLLPQGQPFAGLWMEIFTQPFKLIGQRDTLEARIHRTVTEPVTGNVLTFGAVIPDRQMLIKILFGIARLYWALGASICTGLKYIWTPLC